MQRTGLALVLGVVAAATLGPAAAAQERFMLRSYFGYVDITGDGQAAFRLRAPGLPQPQSFEGEIAMQDGEAFGLAIELRASDRLGIELGGLRANIDSDLSRQRGRFLGSFETGMVPVYLGLNVHPLPRYSRFDLYAGAFVTRVFYGDATRIRFEDEVFELRFADDTGWGLSLGLDIRIGTTFAIVLAGRWFDIETELSIDAPAGPGIDVSPATALDVQPLVYGIGLGLRF